MRMIHPRIGHLFFRSYSQQKTEKRKKRPRKPQHSSTGQRIISFTEDHATNNGIPPEPPEPPSVRLYVDPNYWSKQYTHHSRAKGDRDNTKPKQRISLKIKRDGKAESFQNRDQLIQSHCQHHGLGYLMISHFITLHIRYGTRIFEWSSRYKKPGLDINQLHRDNELFFGILQSEDQRVAAYGQQRNEYLRSTSIRWLVETSNP
jgi:hypothetical protein